MSEIGERVVALHLQGVRSIDIAHQLNVAQSTVHYHLRKRSHPPQDSATRRLRGRGRNPNSQTRQLVAELLGRGLSRCEVARRLGLAKSTVTYHARQLGANIDQRFANRIDWSLVQAYYDEGYSVRECGATFGFTTWAWSAAVQRGAITPRPGFKPSEEIFARNTRRGRGHLKQRLIRAGLKDGSCERCGISDWLGQPLSVTLHHVNGDRLDNRIENLELLCPNCHSQTDNYSGRSGHQRRPQPELQRIGPSRTPVRPSSPPRRQPSGGLSLQG